jgi:hypothetical protein
MVTDVAPTSIDDVINTMSQAQREFPEGDGVGYFNNMYLQVTSRVRERVASPFFADPEFMERLDCVFAGLYFEALEGAKRSLHEVPMAWRPLFARRANSGIHPMAFAIAGMNTHINHDLAIALVRTSQDMGTHLDMPAHHTDFNRVNNVLAEELPIVREQLEPQWMREEDEHSKKLLDILGCWAITDVREMAWRSADTLWVLKAIGPLEWAYRFAMSLLTAHASDVILSL